MQHSDLSFVERLLLLRSNFDTNSPSAASNTNESIFCSSSINPAASIPSENTDLQSSTVRQANGLAATAIHERSAQRAMVAVDRQSSSTATSDQPWVARLKNPKKCNNARHTTSIVTPHSKLRERKQHHDTVNAQFPIRAQSTTSYAAGKSKRHITLRSGIVDAPLDDDQNASNDYVWAMALQLRRLYDEYCTQGRSGGRPPDNQEMTHVATSSLVPFTNTSQLKPVQHSTTQWCANWQRSCTWTSCHDSNSASILHDYLYTCTCIHAV